MPTKAASDWFPAYGYLWPKLDGLFDVRTLAFDLKTDICDSYLIVKRTCKYYLLANYSNTDEPGKNLSKFFS